MCFLQLQLEEKEMFSAKLPLGRVKENTTNLSTKTIFGCFANLQEQVI